MKKYLILVISILFLGACNNSFEQHSNEDLETNFGRNEESEQQINVVINTYVDGKNLFKSDTLKVNNGISLIEAMENKIPFEEDKGLITSIYEQKQDTQKQRYWMLYVNEKLSSVGAKELILNSGDVIDWRLESID